MFLGVGIVCMWLCQIQCEIQTLWTKSKCVHTDMTFGTPCLLQAPTLFDLFLMLPEGE